jgi:hypothetical protein
MVQVTLQTSSIAPCSSRTTVAPTPFLQIPPPIDPPSATSDAGTESLILSEIRNLTREITALKSANQRKLLIPNPTVESLLSYGLRTFEAIHDEAAQHDVELPSISPAIQSWSDALSNYELTNNLEASFDPQLHSDQDSIRMARVMKVINDQQNPAYALPQKRRSTKAKSFSKNVFTFRVVYREKQ